MNKLRLLKLINIFIKYSDEDNYISLKEIIDKLKNDGIIVERKALYNDITLLKTLGYEIEVIKGKTMKYHLLNHSFDNIEAKIIYDAINSVVFIQKEKLEELSGKFLNQLSIYQKNKIIKSSISNQNTITNKNILYIINELQNAIDKNYYVSFKYFDININKQKQYRKQSKKYTLIPYAIILESQKYYCIFYDEKHQNFSNYRIDKMDEVSIIENFALKIPFDINDHINKSFSMYVGNKQSINVEFNNELYNQVSDRFGNNFIIIEKKENSFIASFNITVSNTFYSWIAQFGTNAKIVYPANIISEFKEYLKSLLSIYE